MSRLKLDKEDSLREIMLHFGSIPESYIMQMIANFHPMQVYFAELIIADINCSNLQPSSLAEGLGLNYSIVSHIKVYYSFHIEEC